MDLSYQVSELHWEAAVWVVLDVHDFSGVGQDEKLTTSGISERKKVFKEWGQIFILFFVSLFFNLSMQKKEREKERKIIYY